MKQIIFSVVVSLVIFISYSAASSIRIRRDTIMIPREFQKINIDNYLKNDRAVKFQLKCILDNGPCDRIGKYMKQTIPESFTNRCDGCDEPTLRIAKKLAMHIREKFPEEFKRLVKKYPIKDEDIAEVEEKLGVKIDPELRAELNIKE